MDPNQPSDSTPVNPQRLRDLIALEYRSIVLRRLCVTVEWRILDWLATASCTDREEATEVTCSRCSVVAECLAAAVATDDTADWRGGLNRADRGRLWSGLDRTYRELRDLESMRLTPTTGADRDQRLVLLHRHQPGSTTNGARS